MLRAVGEPRRIERAVRRLQAALRGIPARGVRLTWRGGELRTTIHWARDDGFWYALEPRGEGPAARLGLVLGHAPDPPGRRESITCEINLALAGASRNLAGLVAADEAGTLYLCHSGRMGGARSGQRKAGFRAYAGDAVWRPVAWPDGNEREALVIAPLDSPRLPRLLGRFVETVHRFKAGAPAPACPGLCVEPAVPDSATSACDRRLVDMALHEELAKRGLCWRWRSARCRWPRRGSGAACGRSWWRRPAWRTATTRRSRPCPSPACASAGAARARYSTVSTTRWRENSGIVVRWSWV